VALSALSDLLSRFVEEIASGRVLDPACGSGNFLSVSMQQLLSSEREVISFAAEVGLPTIFPKVGPEQVSRRQGQAPFMITPTFIRSECPSLNTRLPSLERRVLPSAHERQPYPRSADEQCQQSDYRNEHRHAARVG
jgi:hypothetical protein